MKMFTKMLSALMALVLSSALLFGQTVIFEENFDGYTSGGQIACQNPTEWTTWSNAPCGSEDAYVSSLYAHSGSNSGVIAQNNDLVKDFGTAFTTGKYKISFWVYIPTGKAGYFNTLASFAGSTSSWGLEVYFNLGGAGSVNAGGTGATTFTWTENTWFLVENVVDLSYDWSEFWVDGNMIYEWQWTLGSNGVAIPNTLDANDFFGATANDQMFFDDYKVEELPELVLDPPTNLTATVTNNDVHLDWDAPGGGQIGFTDDFESYDDFVLEFSPWTTIDVDGSTTYGMTGIDWPNTYDPQAFIIFNPSMTTPAVTDIIPHSGNKLAACFASVTPDNNDWLISPQIIIESGNVLSFWVKSYTAQYGLERYKVGISTTGTSPSDFTIVSGPTYLQAPATAWTEYTYDLSSYAGDAVYVGIQCVSSDAFIFLVDDFSVGSTKADFAFNTNSGITGTSIKNINSSSMPGKPNTVYGGQTPAKAQLMGYDIYRNGSNIDYVSTPITEYDDMDLSSGTYDYYVKAVYDEGDSPASNTATAIIENPVPPAPQNLVAAAVTSGVQLNWDAVGSGEWIQWDAGVNNGNAVGLTNGGTFSVASHWTPSDLTPYNGFSLQKVQFFPNADPTDTYVIKVWSGATGTTLLYQQNVTSFNVGEWNEVVLTTPVLINTTTDFWFGYSVTHIAGTFPAGSDDGPAIQGKGDMISTGGAWSSAYVLTGGVIDANWNLAGWVGVADGKNASLQPLTETFASANYNASFESAAQNGLANGPSVKFYPNSTKDFMYNVYWKPQGGTYSKLNAAPISVTTYLHTSPIQGTNYYVVRTVLDGVESLNSNEVSILFTSIEEMIYDNTQVYPNPANGFVNINSEFEITSVKVFNYAGQEVVSEVVDSKFYQLNTSKFNPGLYLFQIVTNEGTATKQIVIE
jgi:hypothetical protein